MQGHRTTPKRKSEQKPNKSKRKRKGQKIRVLHSNTNNNDFISTLISPITDVESCEINAALLNLVMKDQFSGLPSEDVATHLNNFVDLCDMQKKKDTDNNIVN